MIIRPPQQGQAFHGFAPMAFGLRCGTGDTNRKIVARRGTQVLFSLKSITIRK